MTFVTDQCDENWATTFTVDSDTQEQFLNTPRLGAQLPDCRQSGS